MVIKRLCYCYQQNEDNNASSLAIHEEKISINIQNEEVTYISTCVLIYSMPHCITYCVLHDNKCIVYIMITSVESPLVST